MPTSKKPGAYNVFRPLSDELPKNHHLRVRTEYTNEETYASERMQQVICSSQASSKDILRN